MVAGRGKEVKVACYLDGPLSAVPLGFIIFSIWTETLPGGRFENEPSLVGRMVPTFPMGSGILPSIMLSPLKLNTPLDAGFTHFA